MDIKFDKEVIHRRIELDGYSLQKSILHVIKFLHEQFCILYITVDFCGLVFPAAAFSPHTKSPHLAITAGTGNLVVK